MRFQVDIKSDKAAQVCLAENYVTGISPLSDTSAKKKVCSDIQMELPKEDKLHGKVLSGSM